MAITRVSQSTVKEGLEKANNFLAGFAPLGMDYDSIATVTVGSGGASSIEFTSIPGTYQHLHVRLLVKNTAASGESYYWLRFNGSSANSYAGHLLWGDGAAAGANAGYGVSSNRMFTGTGVPNASVFTATILDVLDYASTSKNKTIRYLSGEDHNAASTNIEIGSGLWISTSAVTSLTFGWDSNNFAQHSTAALYGLRAP